MRGKATLLITISVACCAALALSACGGNSREGGTLRGIYAAFPDYLDPGLSFTIEGWTAMQNTYLPLLTYAHADGAAGSVVIPALARSMPKVDEGGRRYTLRLRPGLEYSDGTPVRASDFKASVERLFRINSGGSVLFTHIVGAERFAKTKRGGIDGIATDDATGRIAIRLDQRLGVFTNELASLFAAPLPADTPARNMSADPPPATGPYEIVDSEPGTGWRYRRNPAWARANGPAMPDLPDGHVDAIEVKVVGNQSTAVNEIEQDKADWMKNPPPSDRFAEVKHKYLGTQFRLDPQISNYYFWMNTRRAPFDDVRVRRAVNYAIAPGALERIYAGTLKRTQQILPPGMPGYRRYQLYPHDLAKARRLIAAADPADREVTVWTLNLEPNVEAGEYYQSVLKQLGFQTKLKTVAAADYFTVIANSKTPDLDTGWTNWLLDYPHPNDYFEPQLSYKSIQPVHNTNLSNFEDRALTARAERLSEEQLGPRQEREYAALDRDFMKKAPWAPFGNLTLGTFVSSSIDLEKLIVSPIFGQDLTSFEFK